MRTVGCPRHRHDTSRTLHTRAVRTGIFLGLCTEKARLTALPRHLPFPRPVSHKKQRFRETERRSSVIQPHLSEDVHNRGVAAANNPFRAGLSAVLAVLSGVAPCLLPGTARRSQALRNAALTPVCVSAFSDEGRQDEAGGHDLAAGPAQGGPCVSVCTRTCKAHHVCVRDCAHAQGFVMHFIHARAHTRRACCGCPLPGRTLCYT